MWSPGGVLGFIICTRHLGWTEADEASTSVSPTDASYLAETWITIITLVYLLSLHGDLVARQDTAFFCRPLWQTMTLFLGLWKLFSHASWSLRLLSYQTLPSSFSVWITVANECILNVSHLWPAPQCTTLSLKWYLLALRWQITEHAISLI